MVRHAILFEIINLKAQSLKVTWICKVAPLAELRRDHCVIFVVKHSVLVPFSMAGVGMWF